MSATHTAFAEVLDKLEFPWEPNHFVRPLFVVICAGLLATSTRTFVRWMGLAVALLWAFFSLWADPWFTPDIGPALRAELNADQSAWWLRAVLVQAWAPFVVTTIVFLWRAKTSPTNPVEPPASA